jgi:integrase
MAQLPPRRGGVTTTLKVTFGEIQKKTSRRRPYGVRWYTNSQEHSEWFLTKPLAERRRSDLMQAARRGEAFDVDTGLPESELTKVNSRTLLKVAQDFIDAEWDSHRPNTRRSYVDCLAHAVANFAHDDYNRPPEAVLRKALTLYLLPTPERENPPTDEQIVAAASWITKTSRPIQELASKREVAAVLKALSKNVNGSRATASTIQTRRSAFRQALDSAVDVELKANPLAAVKYEYEKRVEEVDTRVVVNPTQARQLLAAVTYAKSFEYLYGYFASIYFAALRPAEANRLRETDCNLPATGWGEIVLEKTIAYCSTRYSNTAATWEEGNLKRRGRGAIRQVPIPPELVAILRDHIAQFGTSEDGRLFHSRRTGLPIYGNLAMIAWRKARKIGLSPAQHASPLARVPYDLRHAAVSTWLAAGVPPQEVAKRAGHTVAVLLKVYAKCLDGEHDITNRRISDKLDGSL